jgi:hypothetical protein
VIAMTDAARPGAGTPPVASVVAHPELEAARDLAYGVLDTFQGCGSSEVATGDVDTLLAGVFLLLDQLVRRTDELERRALDLAERVAPVLDKLAPMVEKLAHSRLFGR